MGIITASNRATVKISKLIHVKGSERLLPIMRSLYTYKEKISKT